MSNYAQLRQWKLSKIECGIHRIRRAVEALITTRPKYILDTQNLYFPYVLMTQTLGAHPAPSPLHKYLACGDSVR